MKFTHETCVWAVVTVIFVLNPQQMCEEFSLLRLTPSRLLPVTNWAGKLWIFHILNTFFSRHHHHVIFLLVCVWHRIPRKWYFLLLRFYIKNHLFKLISVSVLLGSCAVIEPTLYFCLVALFLLRASSRISNYISTLHAIDYKILHCVSIRFYY